MQEKSRGTVKYYGTTQRPKKTPLILKDFFVEIWRVNDKSMGWGDLSHEDRLRQLDAYIFVLKQALLVRYRAHIKIHYGMENIHDIRHLTLQLKDS